MRKFLSDVLINCNLTVSGSTSLGAATGVTVASSDNSNKLATTAWVKGLGFSTTNTTYLLDVPANTTNFRLIGNDSSTDTITLSAAGASSISRVSASELRITSIDSIDYISNVAFANDVITFTGVGNGFSGTINLSTYLTQAEGDARYLGSYSETDTLDTVTSRNGVTTNTIGVGTVNVIGTTAGQELFTVDGTNGRLFTVTDDLSDSLFSVNTIAGLPVIEVFADNTIKLGNFANPIEIDSSANIVIPGTITASGYNDSNWNAAFNDRITAVAVSGTSTKTLTLTQEDGGTLTASWTDIEGTGADGYISNVAITNNALDFTGVGSGFAGNIDLLDIAPVQSVSGNGTTITTVYDGDTGEVFVTPVFNNTIAETGTALVTSGTIWTYINDSTLDIAPIQSVGGDGVSISTSTDTETGQVNIGPIVNSVPTQNSGALVKSGGIWSYIDSLVYDNYQSWNLKTNNVQRTTVNSGGTLDIVAGSNVSVAYGAGGVVTISSTGTSETDTLQSVTDRGNTTTNSIGIGTTSPRTKLHVTDTITTQASIYLQRYTPDWTNNPTTNILDNNWASTLGDYLILRAAGNQNTQEAIALTKGQGVYFGITSTTGSLENDITAPFSSANHAKIGATSWFAGNVGIGTTSPTEKLEVIGNIQVGTGVDYNSKIAFTRNGGSNVGAIGYHTDDVFYVAGHPSHGSTAGNIVRVYGFGGDIRLGDNTNGDVLTVDASNGNVGIGTTSPTSNLHIKTSVDNSVSQGLVIERSVNSDKGYINYNGGGFQFRSTVGDPIVFGETDAEHMRILPDGNVGIGTTNPLTKLDVAGVIKSDSFLIIGGDDSVRIDNGLATGDPVPVVIETFDAAQNIGAFLDFTIFDEEKENMRSGTLQLVFNLNQVMFNEVNTMDIGDTTPCTLDAVNNAGTIDVRFTAPSPTFYIKYQIRTL